MDYVVTGLYARRMLRSLRCDRGASIIPLSWSDSVGTITSGSYVPISEEDCTKLGMLAAPTKHHPLSIIVPRDTARISRHGEIGCQVVSHLPGKPFIKIGSGFCIAGPELLFVDAAATMSFPQLLLLGMELCGTYSFRQSYPVTARPVYQVEPVTSAQKIKDSIERFKGNRIRGMGEAKRAAAFLMDGSASPMESVLALMLRLPISRGGAGLGVPKINATVPVGERYRKFTSVRQFHPDIFFESLPLDIEYESEEFHPEYGDWDALDADSRDALFEKSKRDKQRMRLIQTMGIRVFQATYDDFKTDAAFDLFLEQLLMQMESISGRSQTRKLAKLGSVSAVLRRSSMLKSLLESRDA